MINFYDPYIVLSKVYSDGAYIQQALNSSAIELLSTKTTVKICYGVLDKDIELEYYISKLCEKSPKLKIKIILKIGLYCIKYLSIKPYVVTDELVKLTKKLGKGANAGFINATLRNFINMEIALPTDKIQYLSVKYSYPEFVVKKLIAYYGERAESIMAFDKEYTFIRFNTGVDGEKYLTEKGYEYEKTVFEGLYSVKNIPSSDMGAYMGILTFQSIGSVAICNIVGSGKRLLDCCAAPGGKSVFLADKFDEVVANELHEHRAKLIRTYVFSMNKKNVVVKVGDSTVFDESLGTFDAVLCDVPCSGYGTLKNNPDIKLRKTDEVIKGITPTQAKILKNAAGYVEKGGRLIYSTCSLLNEENDDIVGAFLKENGDFEVEEISSPLGNIKREYGLQFLPDVAFGAGFYVASLKKVR